MRFNPTPAEYAKMDLPILTITGDYDGDQPGALTYYRELMQYGSASERDRSYLIIGPWDHAGTRTPQALVGGLRFGDPSLLNMNDLHRRWYDWTLKGGRRPAFLKKHVAYYVTGTEQWKYADSLMAIGATKQQLYLSSDGHANDAFHSGRLTPARVRSAASDRFIYDPMDTRPAQLETANVDSYLTDERYALNLFGNGVVYHTDQFSQDTEVSGLARFVVWMSMDVPDTDFQITLYQLMPDGTSVRPTSDAMRARYWDSLRTSELAVPNRVYRYEFSHFTFFSREITKGSRLRLVIQCPNTIYQEKNYNSGGVVEHESGKDAKVAHITVYHDPARASFFVLPVVR